MLMAALCAAAAADRHACPPHLPHPPRRLALAYTHAHLLICATAGTGAPEQLEARETLRARLAASPYPEAASDEPTLRWFLQVPEDAAAFAAAVALRLLRLLCV